MNTISGLVQVSKVPIPGTPGSFWSKFQEFLSHIPGTFMSIQYVYIALISDKINKRPLFFDKENNICTNKSYVFQFY